MMHDNHRISKTRHGVMGNGVSIYLHFYFGIFINQGVSISGQNMSKEVSKNYKIRMIMM